MVQAGVWTDERPLIGRDAELGEVAAALEQAARGRGGTSLLRGEAGVGKTRLAEAALDSLSGALVLRTRASGRESPPAYETVTGLLRSLRRPAELWSLEDCSPALAPFRPALAALLPEWRTAEAHRWLDSLVPDDTPPGELWTPLSADALRLWALSASAAGDSRSDELARPPLSPNLAREAAASLQDVRLQAIVRTQLAFAALAAGDRETARALYDEARPVLLACGSSGRLRMLEERLGVRSPALSRLHPPVQQKVPGTASGPGAGGAPRLRVRMLGAFECEVDGRTIPAEAWGARKARSVFKYLLLRRGRPVPLDEVLEDFWPDLTVDGARRALRSTLYRVRRALEPDRPSHARSTLLPVSDDTVALNPGPDSWVDAHEFEDRLAQATRCAARGDASGASRLREEAVALYTGDLLPEDAHEDWSQAPREWLKEQCLSALARLAEDAIQSGDPEAALPFAEQLLAADPAHEPGMRLLLRALAALGRHADAARRFDLFARYLDRHLGLTPERETRELVERTPPTTR